MNKYKIFLLFNFSLIPFRAFTNEYHSRVVDISTNNTNSSHKLKIHVQDNKTYLIKNDLVDEYEFKDLAFGNQGLAFIPLRGKAKDLKIFYNFNTENIFIINKESCDMVIFNKFGSLIKSTSQVKAMIVAQKNIVSVPSVQTLDSVEVNDGEDQEIMNFSLFDE